LMISLPLLRDADFFLRPLDSDRFPGVSSSIKTHSDFADAQVLYVPFPLMHSMTDVVLSRSADDVISAVRTTLSRFGTSHVTVVGHSLGQFPKDIIIVLMPTSLEAVLSP
jgi:hypothetical protein